MAGAHRQDSGGGGLNPGEVPEGIALIWLAHVGFERAPGYGLKYESGFAHTHLGLIGRARDRGAAEPRGAS
ncbi:DUF4260 family protein [Pseudoxanthomonas sp. PXM04]|uniref:DUF4260 family protein n=1 Tax=Pseudoxanthomonas sp. PXM04 TaxID=2769297 RepID=UPI00177AA354|nr:DUF4260 family protein [Pseudoxanthomonas sp. PXM04]MBD9376579.1 DUF4260 family protein [Pseudoxanthomonas sp. PXM04]